MQSCILLSVTHLYSTLKLHSNNQKQTHGVEQILTTLELKCLGGWREVSHLNLQNVGAENGIWHLRLPSATLTFFR